MTTVANDRLVFVHIPKTGGMWVAAALVAAGVPVNELSTDTNFHPYLRQLDREGLFTFAFVREPLSYYGSVWNFFQGKEIEWEPVRRWIHEPFPIFVDQLAQHAPGWLKRFYEQYVGPPEEPIDFVGRYERLVEDLILALRLAGQDFDEQALRALDPMNVTGPRPSCSVEITERLAIAERGVYERFYPEFLPVERE
jgi:hypothetical protein